MHYCFVYKKKVYSCDHYDCNNKRNSDGSEREVGTKIEGMKYCLVAKAHVYSCDHSQCN